MAAVTKQKKCPNFNAPETFLNMTQVNRKTNAIAEIVCIIILLKKKPVIKIITKQPVNVNYSSSPLLSSRTQVPKGTRKRLVSVRMDRCDGGGGSCKHTHATQKQSGPVSVGWKGYSPPLPPPWPIDGLSAPSTCTRQRTGLPRHRVIYHPPRVHNTRARVLHTKWTGSFSAWSLSARSRGPSLSLSLCSEVVR